MKDPRLLWWQPKKIRIEDSLSRARCNAQVNFYGMWDVEAWCEAHATINARTNEWLRPLDKVRPR